MHVQRAFASDAAAAEIVPAGTSEVLRRLCGFTFSPSADGTVTILVGGTAVIGPCYCTANRSFRVAFSVPQRTFDVHDGTVLVPTPWRSRDVLAVTIALFGGASPSIFACEYEEG